MSVTITNTTLPTLLYMQAPFSLFASVTSGDWDTESPNRYSVSQNGGWYVVKVGNGATILFFHKNIAVTNFAKREYVYKYNLPKGCGTPISGFANVTQWRASSSRVIFPSNNEAQVTIPITESTSDGTAGDPYYIPFDLVVFCVK